MQRKLVSLLGINYLLSILIRTLTTPKTFLFIIINLYTFFVFSLTSIVVIILPFFLPHFVVADFYLQFLNLINLASTCYNFTKPGIIGSSYGVPITVTNHYPTQLRSTPLTIYSSQNHQHL